MFPLKKVLDYQGDVYALTLAIIARADPISLAEHPLDLEAYRGKAVPAAIDAVLSALSPELAQKGSAVKGPVAEAPAAKQEKTKPSPPSPEANAEKAETSTLSSSEGHEGN